MHRDLTEGRLPVLFNGLDEKHMPVGGHIEVGQVHETDPDALVRVAGEVVIPGHEEQLSVLVTAIGLRVGATRDALREPVGLLVVAVPQDQAGAARVVLVLGKFAIRSSADMEGDRVIPGAQIPPRR